MALYSTIRRRPLGCSLKRAAPFEVELMPLVVKQLQADKVTAANQPRQIVSDLSYLGAEGGIHVPHRASQNARVRTSSR
jgi:hypothetical protein